MKSQACGLCALSLTATVSGFVKVGPTRRISAVRPTSMSQAEHNNNKNESLETKECSLLSKGDTADICSQFKILTCTSKACSQKRQILQMDQYATFSALYSRKEEAGGPYAMVDVEESPCLGRCKLAPCVAVEHEDYVGTVGLVGMTDAELNDRVFHRWVLTNKLLMVLCCINYFLDLLNYGNALTFYISPTIINPLQNFSA